ncbi:MAG: hypothetical protein HY298_20430 [Verrucomicrobia bacterium]|nr:hypothetical protein [Verrucomicrobiota bacterium]
MQTRKWWLTLLVVAGVLIAMGLLIFKSRQLPPSPPLPSPNGYDDFLKATQVLTRDNQEALKLVRVGLSRYCRVPTIYTESYMTVHLPELSSFKVLAQTLVAEGQLAENEHRTNDASVIYLDTMRFGQKLSHGGLMLDGLVGIACENVGFVPLKRLSASLDAKQCREVIQALEALEKNREPADEIMQQEKHWGSRTLGVKYLFYYVQNLVLTRTLNPYKASMQRFEQKIQIVQMQNRLLMIQLAARAYELEKGHGPKSIAELVSDYLKAIPKDPFTGTNMVYRP